MIVNQLIVILIYMLVVPGDGKRAHGVRPINCANYHMLLMNVVSIVCFVWSGLNLSSFSMSYELYVVKLNDTKGVVEIIQPPGGIC